MQEHKHHKSEHKTSYENKDIGDDNKVDDRKPVDSKKSLLIVLGIVFVVMAIIAASIFASKYLFKNNNIVEYNNYKFEKFEGNKWMTQQLIGGQTYNIPFYYNPTQVLDVPIDPNSITRLRQFKINVPNGTVYLSVDPDESSKTILAGVEYAKLLGKGYNIYNMNIKSAITKPSNTSVEYLMMTCQNQSRNTFIIMQIKSNKNYIGVKNNCITIEYLNATESIRVADAFAFRLLNIITDK